MPTYTNYTTLIGQVISDFDSIFSVLVDKKVKYGEGESAITITSALRDSGDISTTDYSGLLRKLVHVDGVTTNEIIANHNNTDQVVTTTLTNTNGEYTVTAAIPANGYYTTTSTLTTAIDTYGLLVEEKIASASLADDIYLINADSGKLISSVSLKKGGLTVTTSKSSINETGVNYAAGIQASTLTGVAASLEATDFDGKNVALKFKSTITRSGQLVITPTIDATAGYITESDVTNVEATEGLTIGFGTEEGDLTATYNLAAEQTIYIKEGGFQLDDSDLSNASASISGDGNLWATEAEVTAGKGIKLEATVDDITLNGTFTEGYVTEGATLQLGKIEGLSGEKYLKKGSIGTVSVDAKLAVTDPGSIVMDPDDAETGDYTITVATPTADQTQEHTIERGFITESSFNIGITNASKTINIKKGSVTIAPKATVSLGTSDYVSSTDSTGYAFTVTPSVLNSGDNTVVKNFTAGYFEAGTITASPVTSDPTTFYIKKGSITLGSTLTTSLTSIEGDGYGGTTTGSGSQNVVDDIFYTDINKLPQGRDYYTISSTGIHTEQIPGYITSADITPQDAPLVRYLPKANVQRIVERENPDDSTSKILRTYLQVTQAGYLPSGLIGDVTEEGVVEGIEQVYANVKAAIDAEKSAAGIFSLAEITGGYKLSITKSATTSAGYISGTEGQGTVSGDFYIKKGSATITTAFTPDANIADPTATPVTETVEDETVTTGYSFTIAGTQTTTVTAGEGYIKPAEVVLKDVNGIALEAGSTTVETNVSQTIVFEKPDVVAKSNTQIISLGMEIANTVETETVAEGGTHTSVYTITPKLEGDSSITVHADKDGYLKSTDEFTIDILANGSQNAAQPIYLKAGGKGDIVVDTSTDISASDKLAIRPNFDEVKGEGNAQYYEVTAAGKIGTTVTLDTGYYGESNKTVESVTDVALTTVNINKAVGAASLNGSVEITSTDVVFLETTPQDEGETPSYVTITAPVTVTGSVSISKDGYIKNGEITDVTNAVNATTNKKAIVDGEARIALYTDNTKTVGQTSDAIADFTGATFSTADKYNKGDITVSLSANAMGSSVVAQLSQLAARLDGSLTTSR